MDQVQLTESRSLLESQGEIFAKRSSLGVHEPGGVIEVGVAESPRGGEGVACLPTEGELSLNLGRLLGPA